MKKKTRLSYCHRKRNTEKLRKEGRKRKIIRNVLLYIIRICEIGIMKRDQLKVKIVSKVGQGTGQCPT
jgi:hypothetical protein